MTLIYPNIVPENNLRLPDALTVKHGPARLLSRFVLEGDKAARQMGIRLRLRHDFGELLYLNEREVAHGNWFKLVNMYNPAYCDLSPENSYWISGENEAGDIVLTQAGRIYYWPETSLARRGALDVLCGPRRGPALQCDGAGRQADRRGRVLRRIALDTAGFSRASALSSIGTVGSRLCNVALAGRLGDRARRPGARDKGRQRRLRLQACQSQHFLPRLALGRPRGRARVFVPERSLRGHCRIPRQRNSPARSPKVYRRRPSRDPGTTRSPAPRRRASSTAAAISRSAS